MANNPQWPKYYRLRCSIPEEQKGFKLIASGMLHQHCLTISYRVIRSAGLTTDKSLSTLLNSHQLPSLHKNPPYDGNPVENC